MRGALSLADLSLMVELWSGLALGIAAMLEPVVATIVAWAWLRETLAPVQPAGAAIVLAAILLAQTAR